MTNLPRSASIFSSDFFLVTKFKNEWIARWNFAVSCTITKFFADSLNWRIKWNPKNQSMPVDRRGVKILCISKFSARQSVTEWTLLGNKRKVLQSSLILKFSEGKKITAKVWCRMREVRNAMPSHSQNQKFFCFCGRPSAQKLTCSQKWVFRGRNAAIELLPGDVCAWSTEFFEITCW